MNDVIKMGFGEIDALVESMRARVGNITSITDQLKTHITSLGADNAGDNHEAMTASFHKMNGAIVSLSDVVNSVHAAVHEGNHVMRTNEHHLKNSWDGGGSGGISV
jgi:uncharacterized protein YukE